ncbi:Beta-barrel assembly machine subunit BamA [Moheibacter sediminis]|uniref:Outer membrane protein assembly factor BamA n=2 Tax=Moheibacter sediminis TaxID=1434700 RepID=A0A1W1YAX0_9FLAO|nr:Beta-barrel assembly machine subunit BamA [Moheibacter sediminis]
MRKRLNMKSFYTILLLTTSTLLFAQNDSLTIVTDSIQVVPTQNIEDAGYTNPQTYTLGDMDISGENRFTKTQILRFTGLRIGEELEIPGTKINNALKKLWRTNLFSDVDVYVAKIEGNKIFLRLNLVGLPELVELDINGVKKSKREDFIKEHKLDPGIKITNNLKNQVRNSIKNHFLEKGYPDTKVDFIESEVPDDKTKSNLKINVNRGERVKIKRIEFEGNKELRDGQLKRKAMKDTKQKSINFFRSSKFIPHKYNDDLKKVIDEYKSIGFRDAKIVSDTVIRTDNKNIEIKIQVEEGRPYYLGNITFTGNSVFTTEQLERVFSYQKGDRYDAVGIQKRVSGSEKDDDLNTLYMDRGYLFSRLLPVEKSVKNDTIDLEIQISEGEPATYNKVTFSGNDVTHDHVIARELRTKPGDLFSKTEIKRTLFELAGLGYFEPTQINPDIQPNPENNTVDLNWELAHKSSSQIELQGGYGAGTFLGTLGLTFGNFSVANMFKGESWKPVPMGDGQSLSLRAQAGRGYQNYSFSFTEPWIGGRRPTALSTSIYYSRYNYRDINGEEARLGIIGATVGLSQLLTWPDDWFRLSHSFSFQKYNFDNYALTIGEYNYENGSSNNFNYTIGLTRNSMGPDPVFPTSGSEMSVALTVTPPYSILNNKDYSTMEDVEKFEWLEYYKIKGKAYWYKELAGKLVLKMGGEFGYLGTYNNKIGTIPFERFYLGGTGLMGNRFDGREIVPLRGYEDATQSGGTREDITPTGGGSIYDKFTLELRYPITMGQQAKIFALGFAEAGNTWSDTKDFKPFELRRSAGVGVRIFMSAFGMLGFDFGYGFDNAIRNSEPSGWQTHFIIGQQF